jgi:hypothetical protein
MARFPSNTTGIFNTATGEFALQANTNGLDNTAVGVEALSLNTTGTQNTAIGVTALGTNSTGKKNTASGDTALFHNSTGDFNTAIGTRALESNITGSYNIALGFRAGELIDGSNNIDIGSPGVAAESNTIRIGTPGRQTSAYFAGISGVALPAGVAVMIDTDGHLGTVVSSAHFKEAIQPMDKASEAILALKPVSFRYKDELDPAGIPQFGLVAEEVEKVNPDLVARDGEGNPYTVRYDAVNAMLLNEFLKERKTVQELKKQVAGLTAGLQKVSAQMEMNKAVLQTVGNNQ